MQSNLSYSRKQSNPNQHKFVATATVTLFGFKIEITSLRPHNGGEEGTST